jgi:AcrR family transcriptional regulator
VGRKPDLARKPELLDDIVDYLAEHGLGGVSLRPLAEALGVSTYVLVYHFGSKEQLVVEALQRAERRQVEMIERWLADDPNIDITELLRRLWQWSCEPEHLPLLRLAFEAVTLSATETGLPGEAREQLVTNWVDALTAGFVAEGIARREARYLATLVNAAFTGLILDLLATADRARTDRALDALLAFVSSSRPPAPSRSASRSKSVPAGGSARAGRR